MKKILLPALATIAALGLSACDSPEPAPEAVATDPAMTEPVVTEEPVMEAPAEGDTMEAAPVETETPAEPAMEDTAAAE